MDPQIKALMQLHPGITAELAAQILANVNTRAGNRKAGGNQQDADLGAQRVAHYENLQRQLAQGKEIKPEDREWLKQVHAKVAAVDEPAYPPPPVTAPISEQFKSLRPPSTPGSLRNDFADASYMAGRPVDYWQNSGWPAFFNGAAAGADQVAGVVPYPVADAETVSGLYPQLSPEMRDYMLRAVNAPRTR